MRNGPRRGDDPRRGMPDALMVFDGHCRFCSAAVRLVARLDRSRRIRFCPIQSPLGQRLAREHGLRIEDPSTFLFFHRGRALERSDAALALAGRLPWPWRSLGWSARLVPRPLRDALYRYIARHRYRIAGRREHCMVPTRELLDRFVETEDAFSGPTPAGKSRRS